MLLDLVALSLAVGALLHAWFKGGIFAEGRAYFQARGDRIGELLGCPLCLSFHIALILGTCGLILPVLLPVCLSLIIKVLFLYVPAAAGVGLLVYRGSAYANSE